MTLSEVLNLARRSRRWFYQQRQLEKRLGRHVMPQPNQFGLFDKREVLRWLGLV